MEITETAKKVLGKRYYLPNESQWGDVCHRCSNFFGKDEKEKEIFYDLMFNGYFLLNSPALMNAGTNINSFSACFVLPIEDNIESIYKFYMDAAKISKSGGGVGANYSKIRARNSTVNSTNGVASGPLSFAEVQDKSTDIIKQGGRRRGANMMVLDCDHPDIFEFINYKNDKTKLNNFNLSVKISDDFMNKIDKDGREKKIWDKICERAWSCGEPGVLFGDTAERANTVPHLGELRSTNPCGEQWLLDYESCSLGSINVGKFVIGDKIDYRGLQKVVENAVLYMNRVLDKTIMPIPECQKALEMTRKIGIGIMGLHDLLIQLGVCYDSKEARNYASDVMNFVERIAIEKSIELGESEGVYKGYKEGCYKRRNANLTTIAPTGCQSPSTLVITDKGIIRLGEIIDEKGSKWQTIDYEVPQENIKTKATKGYINGEQKTKKILTKTGLELESTFNHQYRTYDFNNRTYDWKRADELKVGDFLASKIGGYINSTNAKLDNNRIKFNTNANKNIEFPKEITPDFAKLLGLIYSDGSVHAKGIRIHFDRKDTFLISYVESLIKNTINIKPTIDDTGTCASICISSIPFKEFLKLNNILKPKAHLVSIPKKVRESSVESLKSFIYGYWLGDGSQTGNTKYIDTCSKTMAFDLAICLRALGQNSYIKHHNTDKNDSHYGNRIMYRIYEKGFGSKSFDKYRYINKENRKRKEFCSTIGDDLFFDEISYIGDSTSMTLDIEVPENNTYVANSFISHNTLSMIADCSSGIEPYYSVITIKNVLDGEKLILINKWFEKSLRKIKSEEETKNIIEKVKEMGTINIEEVPEQLKQLFKGANEISPTGHVLMQAALQKYVDSSISKTINLPSLATIEDVKEMYLLAYREGCKGITVYRDGSRDSQVLTNTNSRNSVFTRPENINFTFAPKRPKELPAELYHCNIKGTPWVVIVGLFNEKPYEVFAGELNDLAIPKNCKNGIVKKTKSGTYSLIVKTKNSKIEFKEIANNLMTAEQKALTRMISLSLRHGVHYEFIVNQLKKASGDITDFASVVNRVLRTYISQYIYEKEKKCLECGNKVIYVEGCEKCSVCGLSKCG